jgi:hypothetical protein
MIKNYKFDGAIPFQTITIPKGTVLFRGLNYDKGSDFTSIFNDLIGYPGSQYYGIDPNMNVFFYPVPYVVDSVKIYDIHMMYITQYDIELFLMIKPSDISRANKDNDLYKDIFTTCSNLGETNKCGQKMNKDDPCFTERFLNTYPQIGGYIGIAEQDAAIFYTKYKDMLSNEKNIDKIKQILPGIVTNSRDIISIPEIVIHPLRFRYDKCHLVPERFYNPKRVIKYCVENRAKYNFFPLLYFTNIGIYTLESFNIEDYKLIFDMVGESKNVKLTKSQLYKNVDEVFSKMLDEGYKVNNVNYKVFVDNRTGFYRALIEGKNSNNKNNKRPNTRKRVFRNFKDDTFEGYIDSYIVKPNGNSEVNTILSLYTDYINKYMNCTNLANTLENNGYSVNKQYFLDRGDPKRIICNYYIDKVLDRPDLNIYTNRRKIRDNITRKRLNTHINKSLSVYGINPKELNDISSVSSIEDANE